jgi:hypothetical protein
MHNYRVVEYVEKDLALKHHGILGMKWGVRRYQNKDGSLTNEGRERYLVKHVTGKGPLMSTHPVEDWMYKGSGEENIAREIFDDHLREVNRGERDLSQEMVDHYKNEYMHDLDDMLPKDMGKIDRDALIRNFADQRVKYLMDEIEDEAESKKMLKESEEYLTKNPKDASIYNYADYHDTYVRANRSENKDWWKNKEIGKMTKAERASFDLVEKKLATIKNREELIDTLSAVSMTFDGAVRDEGNVLVYNPKTKKIVEYYPEDAEEEIKRRYGKDCLYFIWGDQIK